MRRVSQYTRNRLFDLYRVDLLRLDSFQAPNVGRVCPYKFSTAQADDIEMAVEALHPTEREGYGRLFGQFVKEGRQCVVATRDGEIAGYYWSFHETYRITNDGYRKRVLTLVLPPEAVVFGNGFIAEHHRLKGLFPFLVTETIARLAPDVKCFTTIDVGNVGSFRAHRRLGFERIASFSCRSILGLGNRWAVHQDRHRLPLGSGGKPVIPLVDVLRTVEPRDACGGAAGFPAPEIRALEPRKYTRGLLARLGRRRS